MSADVAVVGGGHNGLAAAVRLARAGRRVVVLEGREEIGGLAAARELHPGYRLPGVLHDDGAVRPRTLAALGLAGLRLREAPPVYVAEAGGPGLVLHRAPAAARDEIGRLSPRDAEAYGRWRGFLERVEGPLARLLEAPPPPLAPDSVADLWGLARQGLALRLLGRRDFTELLRVVPMCAADWLGEHFESPLLAEALAAPAVAGTFLGPWSAGSAANLLLAETAPGRWLEGGPAALVAALAGAARERGVEVRTGARVRRIRVAQGRTAGVTLDSGEEIEAPLVAAACDPKQALLSLLHPADLPLRATEELRAVRARGTAAKVHLALAGPLELAGRPGETPEAIRIGGGHPDRLERAFDAVKYRRFSDEPHLEVRVPSVTAPGLAPEGHHVASILVSFAPYELAGGWNGEQREALGKAVLGVLERHAPGVRGRVVAAEVLAPPDLEREFGLTGGCLHHAEHALDQLFSLRPAPCAARYRTPVPGLYLAGSGSHPGGGVTAAPGWLAAEAILEDT